MLYVLGTIPRPYGEPHCIDPPNNEYPRPMSPPPSLLQFQNCSANSFPYPPRGPATGIIPPSSISNGFPPHHHHHHHTTNVEDISPFNHQQHQQQQHFSNNGSHENNIKLPANSPANSCSGGIIPTDANLNTSGSHPTYSVSTNSSSSGDGQPLNNHMPSPIGGQGQNSSRGLIFSQQNNILEDNTINSRNDNVRSNQKILLSENNGKH